MVLKHILRAIGHMTVDAIAVEHIKDWFASMAEKGPSGDNDAMPVLSAEKIARLNAVLAPDEFCFPQAVSVIRLLMPTGCRPFASCSVISSLDSYSEAAARL